MELRTSSLPPIPKDRSTDKLTVTDWIESFAEIYVGNINRIMWIDSQHPGSGTFNQLGTSRMIREKTMLMLGNQITVQKIVKNLSFYDRLHNFAACTCQGNRSISSVHGCVITTLLLIWENEHPPYWNYTSGFDLTYWSSRVLSLCIDAGNVKFLAPTVPEMWRGPKI